MTIDLEGREKAETGGSRSVVVVESWESLSLSWFVLVSTGWRGSTTSFLREVLRRFLMGVEVALEVAVVGERQGRSRRRASIFVMGFQWVKGDYVGLMGMQMVGEVLLPIDSHITCMLIIKGRQRGKSIQPLEIGYLLCC